MESDLKKVENLLSAGVDVNESFWNNGNTPLHIAAKDDDTNLLVLLLKYNPKLDSKNDNGFTPLHCAIVNNNTTMAKLLLDAGADCSFTDPYGNTPLHLAAKHGNTELCKLLLEQYKQIDKKNDNGFTPLFLAAAISGNADTCKILIDAGATVNITDVFHSPIHWAARNNHQEVYELLNTAHEK